MVGGLAIAPLAIRTLAGEDEGDQRLRFVQKIRLSGVQRLAH